MWLRGYKKGGEKGGERDDAESLSEPNRLGSVCLKDGRGASWGGVQLATAAETSHKVNLL